MQSKRGFRRADGQIRGTRRDQHGCRRREHARVHRYYRRDGFPLGENDTPYTVAQYKNMAGRAGRLGFEAEGKAILLADTPMERNQLFRQYVQGQPEVIRSSFNPNQPGNLGDPLAHAG